VTCLERASEKIEVVSGFETSGKRVIGGNAWLAPRSKQHTENETLPAFKKLLRFADYPGSVFF
jgi:hypothetical protein